MKILSPKVHGVIDYVSVFGLALAPTLFGLSGAGAVLAYLLAGIHLTMTVLTAFPLGLVKLVPLKVHGLVELVVGISLAVAPWALSGVVDFGHAGQPFFSGFGAVLILVWFVTDYGASAEPLR